MKKFSMDLSKFKKVHADEHTSTLRHADGHEFKIAHSALKPELKKQIDALPHFAEGGDIDPTPVAQNVEQAEGSPNLEIEPISEMKPAEAAPNEQAVRAPAAVSAPVSAPIPESPVNGLSQVTQQQLGALGEQRAGQMMQAQAAGELGDATAKRVDDYTQALKQNQERYDVENGRLIKERQALQQDIAAGHIDPQKFIKNMSTGDKVMKAIGLVFGGMGAGLTHGPNLAAKYLEDQINRDIDAQKMEFTKKDNLLAHNLRESQDLRTATEMTRLHLNDTLSAHLKAEAAKTQSLQVKGQLLEIAGKFDLQSAQLQHQLALQKMMLGQAGSNDSESAFKAQTQYLRMSGQDALAKDMEAKHVPGVGQASREVPAEAMKELIGRQDLQHKLHDLQAFSEKHSGDITPAVVAEGKAKAALVQDAYRRANAQGVFKESEKDFVETILHADPTQFFAKYRAQKGYQQAIRDNMDSLNNLKQAYGLPTQEAPQYKIVNGVKYMRGPRGEAIPVK